MPDEESTEQQVAGEEEAPDAPSPPDEAGSPDTLTPPLSTSDLIREGLRGHLEQRLEETPVEEPEEEEDDGDEEELVDGEEAADEPEAAPPAHPNAPALIQGEPTPFAAFVANTPHRISELAGRDRGEAIRGAMALHYSKGQADVLAQLTQEAQRQAGQATVSEKDQLRKDDPIAFTEWLEENPEEFNRYTAAKAGIPTPATNGPAPPAQNGAAEAGIVSLATAQYGRLQTHPEALQRIVEKTEAGEYAKSDAGLRKLTQDVDAEFAAMAASQGEQETKARRRTQGGGGRKRRPMAPGGGGTSTPGGGDADVENETDPRELFRVAARRARSRATSGS